MRIFFEEQDLVDSVCVFISSRHGVDPERVEAELFFEESRGFSATAKSTDGWRHYNLSEQELIDAVAVYLRDYHNFNPNRLEIEMFFDTEKGFSALIVQQ